MGTRRSKHNKGRKPFYKEHDRTTLADIAPVEAEGWQAEAEQFFHDRRLNAFREARPHNAQRGYLATRIGKPEPKLSETVSVYLAKREKEQARHRAAQEFPDVLHMPERIANGFDCVQPADHVEPSQRDVLIQLFIERKISAGQLHAGRKWQMYHEHATIQPNMSIAWHQSVSRMPYQKRGDLSDVQSDAMAARRKVHNRVGPALVAFLDFCLDADRGRTDLLAALRIDERRLSAIFDDMLTTLCQCLDADRFADQAAQIRSAA